jgi:ABC-2 type transport system permease protein
MTLVRVELERFRCRPVLWLVAGLLLLASAGFVAMAWSGTAPPSAAEVAEGTEAYEAAVVRFEGVKDRILEQCREDESAGAGPAGDCLASYAPERRSYLPPPPWFPAEVGDATTGLTLPILLAALAMGVSFATAEFGARTMSTWLTFAPRRSRVFASKSAAAALGALPAALAALGLAIGGIALVFVVRGAAIEGDGAWSTPLSTAAHLLPAAVVAALLGAGLAFAVRHAAAVAGIVVWWALAVEFTLPQVAPRLAPATLGLNLRAWLEGGASYTVPACGPDPDLSGAVACHDVDRVVGALQGGLVLVLATAVVLAVGALVFRRRAVT